LCYDGKKGEPVVLHLSSCAKNKFDRKRADTASIVLLPEKEEYMMKTRKALRTVLIPLLLIGLFRFGTTAIFPDYENIEHQTAVNMSIALNIIKGKEDGNFDPQGTATRAEMTKMICIILNKGNEPKLGTIESSNFYDVNGHWAKAYIDYCSHFGIIAGMGNGNFNPDQQVTGTQAAKMLLVALGYDAVYEGFNGNNWALNINIIANQKGLYDDLTIDPNAPINRDNAAQMIWNALNAKMVKYRYGVTSILSGLTGVQAAEEYEDHRTLLSYQYGQASYCGQLVSFSYNTSKQEWSYTIEHTSNDPTSMTFTSKLDYTEFYGQSVSVIYKQNDGSVDRVYAIYADDSKVLFSGVLKDLTVTSSSVKFNGITYDLDQGSVSKTKIQAFSYDTAFDLDHATTLDTLSETQLTYSFKAIDNDGDGAVDFLLSQPYTVEKVRYVTSDYIVTNTTYQKRDCTFYEGIATGDYIKITAAANTENNRARLDPVDPISNGTVSKVRGNEYYINNERYYLTPNVSMNVGDTVKDAVVVNHFIFDATVSHLAITDYAVVINAIASNNNGIYGHQAKLLFSDGTKKIVNTNQAYTTFIGQMVVYEINRDHKYVLTSVDYATATDSCFDKAITAGDDKITSNSSSNQVQHIDHCLIDTDGVIFVQEGDGTADNPYVYHVISGAKLLSANKNGLSLIGAFADKESSGGYHMVKLAFLKTSEAMTLANSQYGYALLDHAQVKNEFNETVYEYTLWDGREIVQVLAESGLTTAVHKGDVVTYTRNLDGEIVAITPYATTQTPAAEVAAITGYDGRYIRLNDGTESYEISEKTVIIYVDNDDVSGLPNGEVQLATETSKETGYTDGTKNYFANALVLYDANNQINLLVIDVHNDLLNVR
jgi:hypothetical protein